MPASTEHTAPVVPRWEWRTFAADFESSERALAAFSVDRAQESDEMYLLSQHSDPSIKVRDELLDVKHLERVSDDGLELWKPVLKAAFPVTAEDAASVLTASGVPVPPLERAAYTHDQLADELIAPEPSLLALRVHKRRVHYLVDDCMVELTDLRMDHGAIRTIAIESPDPALVRATVDRLGLTGLRNVNMARGLKRFAGFGAHRYAVVDVGTNSVKFFLGEVRADLEVQTITDRAEISRLGEGLDARGVLSEPAIERTLTAIAAMVDEARQAGAVETIAVGTAGLRAARNRDAFDAPLHDRFGITIEVISGEEEGRLAYRAATSALPVASGTLVVFDSGGGSTQFTFGHSEHVDERFSLDIGAVRIAERYDLAGTASREVLEDALRASAGELQRLEAGPRPDAIIGMGGTMTNLAAVKHEMVEYDPATIHGTVLDIEEIDRQIDLFRTQDVAQRRGITGLQPNRADVILAGACIVRTILTTLGRDSVTVTDRGLRHGLFVERFVR
jgi:exopolyphosphatase/guanosine-5'-triphosphate,3'-diphosphate pyrophosphatase